MAMIKTCKMPVLQEKSASGSVATFNTALAMPLDSCVVDFQDGTGISKIGMYHIGKNIWDEEWENGYYNRQTGNKDGNNNTKYIRSKNLIPCLPSTQYYFKSPSVHAQNTTYLGVLFYDAEENFIFQIVGIGDRIVTTTRNAHYITFYVEVGTEGAIYHNDISLNYPSTATDYEPYTGETKTFTFGKTIQNGSLNVLTGELTNNDTTPPEVINLGGMEIDTLKGVNNIWADTGDIDLTYKDLDIAKRGNFREVFKLP